MDIKLYWHNYKYFPYEKELAIREIETLSGTKPILVNDRYITLGTRVSKETLKKLVYFSHVENGDNKPVLTYQKELESANESIKSTKRQITRYSSHGLHEYKGKFNPQVVRALLNIFSTSENSKVLDPFCGSGTSLIESSHANKEAVGFDINPLAVFISNAKIKSLQADIAQLRVFASQIFNTYKEVNIEYLEEDTRRSYLKSWFPEDIYIEIEKLRLKSIEIAGNLSDIFLVLISNNLREYSLQEPADLRIRRRISPFSDVAFIEVIKRSIDKYFTELEYIKGVITIPEFPSKAILHDIRKTYSHFDYESYFDIAITSPPYATALPYIDTQRLSLVWLGLIESTQINPLEEKLIGSREFKKTVQKLWIERMLNNADSLPEEIAIFCIKLQNTLSISDGFRRQAVPSLLYRYFSDMQAAFRNVSKLIKNDGIFALVVGHNQTTIGGVKYNIDTPQLLTQVAENVNWEIVEITKLQAYQRYSLHSSNAINEESLIVLKNKK